MENGDGHKRLLLEVLSKLGDQEKRLIAIEAKIEGTRLASIIFGGIGLFAGVCYALLSGR